MVAHAVLTVDGRHWRSERVRKRHACLESGEVNSDDESDVELDGGLRVPASLWNKLYRCGWEVEGRRGGRKGERAEGGRKGARERGSEGARERGSEGARERGSEGARERGSEGARERGSEGARERGSEGARERGMWRRAGGNVGGGWAEVGVGKGCGKRGSTKGVGVCSCTLLHSIVIIQCIAIVHYVCRQVPAYGCAVAVGAAWPAGGRHHGG